MLSAEKPWRWEIIDAKTRVEFQFIRVSVASPSLRLIPETSGVSAPLTPGHKLQLCIWLCESVFRYKLNAGQPWKRRSLAFVCPVPLPLRRATQGIVTHPPSTHNTHTRMQTHTHTHTQTWPHLYTHTHTHAFTHKRTYIWHNSEHCFQQMARIDHIILCRHSFADVIFVQLPRIDPSRANSSGIHLGLITIVNTYWMYFLPLRTNSCFRELKQICEMATAPINTPD